MKDRLHEEAQKSIDSRLDEIQTALGTLTEKQETLESIQDKLAELLQAVKHRESNWETPPIPVIDQTDPSKKKHVVERERVIGTVDRSLFELFHDERQARGVTVSRMLDIVLWKYFGKPKLSFELIDDKSALRSGPDDHK